MVRRIGGPSVSTTQGFNLGFNPPAFQAQASSVGITGQNGPAEPSPGRIPANPGDAGHVQPPKGLAEYSRGRIAGEFTQR
jgi:hypothetical protein